MMFLAFAVLILVLGGVNFYLAYRMWQWLHYFFSNLSVLIPFSIFMVMTLIMIINILNPFNGFLRKFVSVIGSYWMGIFVYLLISFLLTDLIALIPWLFKIFSPSKMAAFRLVSGICATLLTISVSLYGFCHARNLYTTEYDIKLSENSVSEMNVVLISDVHLGAIGSEERLDDIVTKINEMNPDLVCISGDFFNTDFRDVSNPQKAIRAMNKIKSRYGTYACLGNHDSGQTCDAMIDFFDKANVKLLNDEYTVIDDRLILAGRLDASPINGAGNLKRGSLSAVLEGADENLPVIMLDHNPANVEKYQGKVNLILSGHTHKGQIFPANLITNALYEVDYGYYKTKDNTQVIVTSGAGIWGLPMRVGTNCEIVKINLRF